MPFDPDDPRLTAFALGELEPADRDAIEAILRDDPDGRAFVLGIEETARLLTEELRHETTATFGLDTFRREAIEERLAEPTLALATDSAPKKSRLGIRLVGFAAAASLLGVAVGLMLPAVQSAREDVMKQVAATRNVMAPPGAGAPRTSEEYGRMMPKNRAAYRSSGYPDTGRTPSASPLAASKPASATTSPGDLLASSNSPRGNVDYFTDGAHSIGRDSSAASSSTTRGFGAVKDRGGDPNQKFGYVESAPLAHVPAASISGLQMTPSPGGGGMGGGMGGMGGGMGGMGGSGRGTNPPPAYSLGVNGPASKEMESLSRLRKSQYAGRTILEARDARQPLPQIAAGKPAALSAIVPGQTDGEKAKEPALALRMKEKSDAAQLSDQLPANKPLSADGFAASKKEAGARGLETSIAAQPSRPPLLAGTEPAVTTYNGGRASLPSLRERSEVQIARSGRGEPGGNIPPDPQKGLDPSKEPALQAPAQVNLAKDLKAAAPEGLTLLNQNAVSFEGKQNQVALTAEPPPPAEAKPSEPLTQLALNNNVDVNQQRIDALQREVVDKETELRRLREQTELLQRRRDEEQARVDREAYARVYDNPFTNVVPGIQLSTFAVDVDTASYANVRRFLMQQGQLPPVDAVRIEEMINYFTYDDPAPTGNDPFSVNVEVAACPWDGSHRLARIGLKGKTIDKDKRPMSNLVFLIDVSGSMADLNKLPFLKAGMKLLVEQLSENDRVGIVTYSNEVRVALPSTPCHRKDQILAVLDSLQANGGTNGGEGIQMAYKMAQENFIKGGTNRVILATDGDFNIGLTKEQLLATCEERAKGGIFLSVLGFGQGNIQDEFMEQLADKGNGNYSYIDNIDEARKVLVRQMSGTLVVIAKDVKVQVEFNPDKVAAYRLIGYENRVMDNAEFRNDKKDAGEIGAGHSVTALYEIVPNGEAARLAVADRPLKYKRAFRSKSESSAVADKVKAPADLDEVSPETLTVYLRYKQPDGDKATEISKGVTDDGRDFGRASTNFKFASAVAGFGMLLRASPHRGSITLPAVLEIASSALGDDRSGDRKEFVELVKQTERIVQGTANPR